MDPVLAVASALLFGATLSLAPVAGGLAAFGMAVICRAHLSQRALLVVAMAVGVGWLGAARKLERFAEARVAARDAFGAPARCAGRAVVAMSPTWAGGTASYVAELSDLECEGRRFPFPIRTRLYGGQDDLRRGDLLDVVAQLAPIRLFHNLGAGDPAPGAARRDVLLSGMTLSVTIVERGTGLRASIDRARAHARRRIEATFSPNAAPLARALVLGENDLDDEDDEAFRRSGLAHMLAVSGTHLVFAVLALVRGLRFALVRVERLAARFDVSRASAAIGALLALVYADFAGGSGSAWRAAWMLAAGLGVRAIGRHPSTARSVAASMLVGALIDPLAAFDLSFLLSLAATAGLVVVGQRLSPHCQKIQNAPLRHVTENVAATFASMLPCAPLLALLAPDITLAGVVANVIAAPFGEAVALPLCLVHSLLGAVPPLERGVALVASGALLVVRAIARASASASFLAFGVPCPSAWHLCLLVLGAAGTFFACAAKRHYEALVWLVTMLGGLAAVELVARQGGRPQNVLRVSALDVGQGDATLVDLPDGSLMLVDGGGFVGSPVDPGRSVILPVLRSRRRARVDIAVLSHPHPDHFTGLASALAAIEVGELWDSGQGEREGAGPIYAGLLRDLRARGVPVRGPRELCGRARRFGSASVEVLGPCPDFTPGRDANDNSLVVRIVLGERAVLLTGDAEHEEEAELVGRYGGALRADLLKVGHHGSRTSTGPRLLDAVRPSIATISAGVRNRFGHPHEVTLERLGSHGVLALRLDRVGNVMWQTDGHGIEIRTFSVPR